MASSIAVITGANSGIGFEVARRLLSEVSSSSDPIQICLACRNMRKAESAKQELLKDFPSATIDLLQVDTSSPDSAIAAANELKRRYRCIKWLFFNAGIMPVKGLNIKDALCNFNREFWANLFSTGEGFLCHTDWEIDNNLQAVFATNVLGHYIMLKELEDHLISQSSPCHIIWTSSNTARVAKLDPTDIQHKKGDSPYPHSKKIIDILSVDINRRLNSYGIYSDTTCPGMVVSQITTKLMPLPLWYLILPIIFIIRIFVTHFITFKPVNGTVSLVWLAKQDPLSVDHSMKYFSRTPPYGDTYVYREKIPYDEGVLNDVVTEMNNLVECYISEK